MALSTRFRGVSALAFAAAALAAILPQSAAASSVPTGSDAVAAVTALLSKDAPGGSLPADEAVLSAVFSPDGTHVAYRQAFDEPAGPSYDHNAGSDDWVMRADGTAIARLTNDVAWQNSASARVSVSDPVWSPNSRGLAYVAYGPGHPLSVVTRVFTATATDDDWTGQQAYGDAARDATDLTYTPDGRYLVYRLGTSYPSLAIDYAIDLGTATRYLARKLDTSSGTAVTTEWAPECATITEGSYTPPIHSGNDVIDALAGPTPACKFGVAPDPNAPTGTTPAAASGPHAGATTPTPTPVTTASTPTLNDSPGITGATNPNITPISERLPATTIAGPSLKITDIGTGLAAARSKGVHVKYSLDRLAKVKVWVILTGSGARYAVDEAFAGVPAKTIGRSSVVSSKAGDGSLYAKFDPAGKSKLAGLSRVTLQVKMTATDVAGRTTTVVKTVKLRR